MEEGVQGSTEGLEDIGIGSGPVTPKRRSVCLSTTDVISYRRLSAIVRRAELDLALEYMRSHERNCLLTGQHTEKAEKSDRGRCRRPHLDEPIDDSDCNTQEEKPDKTASNAPCQQVSARPSAWRTSSAAK